jgi:hypothetical protein
MGMTGAQEALWVATPGVRAGSVDGPAALSTVFDVEVGRGGEILAAQPTLGTIALFAADGRFLRSIGRRGGGPGEFRVLGGMNWSRDTLSVVDFGRLHLFTPDLTYVRTITFPTLRPPPGVGRVIPGFILRDGSILGVPIFPDSGRAVPVVRVSSGGTIIDTITHVLDENGVVSLPLPGRSPANLTNPWIADPLWVPEAGGASILIVNRPIAPRPGLSAFELVRVGLQGDTLLTVQFDYTPLEISAELRDRVYTEMARRVSESSTTRAQVEREARRAIPAPRFHPPVSEVLAGRDGTIWLRREELGRDSVEWHVFSQSGRPVAKLFLPGGFRVRRAQSDRIWGVEKDSLDVPFVRVYDVRAMQR